MAERVQLDEAMRNALLSQDSLPPTINVRNQSYTPRETIAAGYKGAVWKVTDEYGRWRAAKLALFADYEDRSFLTEFSLAAKLEPYPQFAKFDHADIIDVSLPQLGERKFVCFIEEWINGWSLRDFLTKHRDQLTCSFLVEYVQQMCAALSALRAQGLRHDDLHSGNVMISEPPPGAHGWQVKVVDTGSLKLFEPGTKKPKDDHLHFVEHIVAIYNALWSQKLLRVRDRRFLRSVKQLVGSMLDDEPAVALRDPERISTSFRLASTRADAPTDSVQETLQSPFEYISAEHIADDRLLVQIFASSCPWLEKVAGPDPCLITGPRGCGKSTILRWLSLKAHLHKDTPEVPLGRIAGFYVSCSADLQNRLGWIRTPVVAERFQAEVVHYFNLLLTHEVIQTLYLISQRPDSETYWGVGNVQEQRIYDFIQKTLQTADSALQGTTRLRQALDLIEGLMVECHVQLLKRLNLAWTSPETFLGDLTELLAHEVPFFRKFKIAFLVDDFSTHRVPDSVQHVLNRIIWERRPSHIFKLSSEKHGAALSDPFDATVDVTREMVEVDCGREYLSLDDQDQLAKARTFARELLANRLKAANYAGTPEELLGQSEWPEGNLARALRGKAPGRKDDQYHGLECISALCSGDISALLLVYRRVFERGGVSPQSRECVSKSIQHAAIQSVSRELLEAIKHVFPYGPQMYQIVSEFGRLVRLILEKGRMIKKGHSDTPPQCPRIEVDYEPSVDTLSAEQYNLARELVRRAIFIEMEPGRSRHDFATTVRWQLRRVYLPAFGAALSKNLALKWRSAQFKFFLTDPHAACEMSWNSHQQDVPERNQELPFKSR